jgi:RNA polymerase sigma-70 factor (ECF subfamily)
MENLSAIQKRIARRRRLHYSEGGNRIGGGVRQMAGDSDPWQAWLDQHGAALMLLARHWVGGRTDAEDVVQEAFIRFWRSRERVAEPVAYLYACVKRCAMDWRRGRDRRSRREQISARPESESRFDATLEQRERRDAIEAALVRLPDKQAEVLVMRIWGGLTFPQIAAAIDVSVATAASRYRYALDRLREQLAAEAIL